MANSSDNRSVLCLDHVSTFTIHTGNIINELKRKTTQSATEELLECMKLTLANWVSSTSNTVNGFNVSDSVEWFNNKYSVKINKEERKDLKLTVKILLNTYETDTLIQAVNKALEELDVVNLESVIIAFPPIEEKLKLEHIQPIWETLESLVEKGQILTIGISDLDSELLIELYNWARIKPSVNQVNLASCCVIPPEMQAFAKEKDIQLLTHNDPKELLPQDRLDELLSQLHIANDQSSLNPLWIVRYSALVKCRGVIQNKGFIVCLKKKK